MNNRQTVEDELKEENKLWVPGRELGENRGILLQLF